jgi:hypothetical protein
VQHCTRLSARLAGINGVDCPHVLHAMMAHVSGVSKTHTHALETHEPSCKLGQLSISLYLRSTAHTEPQDVCQRWSPLQQGHGVRSHKTRSNGRVLLGWEERPRAIGHVVAPSPPRQGGDVQSHETHGSAGAHPSRKVGSKATGYVVALEPSLAGRGT